MSLAICGVGDTTLSPCRPTRSLPILWRADRLFLVVLMASLLGRGFVATADELSPIEEGRYVSRIADCEACHTRTGGTPFTGGLPMGTPFGTLTTPNITPDPNTGIGAWSDEEFYQAVTNGIGRRGEYLYPAMPFTSFTRMTRSDVLAIKAYLFSLKPVNAPRVPNDMAFPFDIRLTLFAWRELYFHPGVYQPDPKHSPEWNRGAYLVEGAGHCGECHSPRNILGGTETENSLAGGQLDEWRAPNISADPRWGIGGWSVDDIVTFLKTDTQKTEGLAFGPMMTVVHDSLSYVSSADLRAMAMFLKSGPERVPDITDRVASGGELQHGQKLYSDHCAKCHQDTGQGFVDIVPKLALNAAVISAHPNNIVAAVLNGLQGTGTYGTMPSFAGDLNDQEISDVTNYVRESWGNRAPTNATPALVASVRKAAAGQQ